MATEIAYIMGRDARSNRFYTEAAAFFTDAGAMVKQPAAGGPDLTLKDVLDDLGVRAAKAPPEVFDTIHIVTHATGFGGVQFALDPLRQLFYGMPFLDQSLLTLVHAEAKKPGSNFLKPLSGPAVTDKTTIQIDGCDIGRDLKFLKLFGLMFGSPKRVLGSRRLVMFMHSGAKRRMMPSRSWSVPMNSPTFPATTPAGWVAIRKEFVSRAVLKFSMKASENDPLGFVTIETTLKGLASAATDKMAGGPFFFTEGIRFELEIFPAPADDAAAIAKQFPAQKTSVSAGRDVDDTTVATVVATSNFDITGTNITHPTDGAGRRIIANATIVALAEPLGVDSDASNREQYSEVIIAPPKAPSPGPATPP